MKKYKSITLVSIIGALFFVFLTLGTFGEALAFLVIPFLTGFFLIVVQRENVVYRFLYKLFYGSILFGFFSLLFLILKINYLSEHSSWWEWEMMIMVGVLALIAFISGLIGVVLKGFYYIYGNKLDRVIIFLGPFILMSTSLLVQKVKHGGTIVSTVYGWPYPLLIHNIKDIFDGDLIDKWIFIFGSFYHNYILNYLLYLLLFLSIYFFLQFLNKKLTTRKVNTTILLFVVLALFSFAFMSFLPIKKANISKKIQEAAYCESDLDCVAIESKCPFGCAIPVNINNKDRIKSSINFYPSNCVYSCPGTELSVCLNNKCEISFKNRIPADSNIGKGENLSIIAMLLEKLKTTNQELNIAMQSTLLWWNDIDGYSIFIPTDESIILAKSKMGEISEFSSVPEKYFSQELGIAKQIFKSQSYVLNKRNSSENEFDTQFYDYIQAYEKNDEVCVINVNSEYGSYGCKNAGLDSGMCYKMSVSCSKDFVVTQSLQRPFLEALELQNKETVIRVISKEEPFYQLAISGRRAGSAGVLKKEGDVYRVLFIGQEAPPCDIIDKESIPSSVLSSLGGGNCWTGEGYEKRID